MRTTLTLATGLVALAVAPVASGQVLFNDSFDTDTSANWNVNAGPGVNTATFAFDYSAFGIPKAPNSPANTTLGLRLRANIQETAGTNTGTFGGISVSPKDQNFAGSYILRADVWMNAPGPFPAGAAGSTNVTGVGVLTSGTRAQWAGSAQESVHFGTTADGGSTADYRAYSPAAQTSYPDGSPVYPATNRNNLNTYYAPIVGATVPQSQTDLYPATQTGTLAAGAAGMTWRQLRVHKFGNNISYFVDNLRIATVDAANITGLGGGNILLNQYDINATTTTAELAPLQFGLFDNVIVDTSSGILGDMDQNGAVNNQDIAPFVSSLTSTAPLGPGTVFAGDVNADGIVNNQDIAPFVALLTGGSGLADVAGDPEFAPLVALVPEPGSVALLALGGLAVLRRRRSA
jgi:hypothetical protein